MAVSEVCHRTCAEMVEAWDNGDAVWSVEMGGLGPGYEQAIQVLMIETIRQALADGMVLPNPSPTDPDERNRVSEAFRVMADAVAHRVDKWPGCGFSGAQVGAAQSAAFMFLMRGPVEALKLYEAQKEKDGEDRLIQVSRTWPRDPVAP